MERRISVDEVQRANSSLNCTESIRIIVRSIFPIVLVLLGCSKSPNLNVVENATVTIRDQHFEGRAQLTKTSKGFKIALINSDGEELDRTIFNYKPYQLDTGDINRDGRTEILVGLIKSTEFDPGEKKRLFILRIDEGQLRPLWLGSKVCQQLIDFKALSNGVVKTLEQTKKGNYAIGIYEWQGFGLTLIKYISNEKPYDEAIAIFNS
jgi:hypothetical protein